MIAFGPVPSRRLGMSLGVNNIPFKHCTYSCAYCQVGPTHTRETEPRAFWSSRQIAASVEKKLDAVRRTDQKVSVITFVPDGEPTLDQALGAHLRAVSCFDLPVAVITNGSLLHLPKVREALSAADIVSVKVDTVRERTWRRINRPHRSLTFTDHLAGIRAFASMFRGVLLTETMLVAGTNDGEHELVEVADFVAGLEAACAYVAAPTRPPADPGIRAPEPESILRAHQIFAERVGPVELLVTAEEGPFGHSGDAAEDLLSILAVHPMREESVEPYLAEAGRTWALVERLIHEGRIVRVRYRDDAFLVRRFAPELAG